MADAWPWLAVAAVGALHGLNPATGWALAAAWGVRSHDRARALRALVPIAVGHSAALAWVAGAVRLGASLDPSALQGAAAVSLIVVAIVHWRRRAAQTKAPCGHAGLALWSFMMSTAHGAGLMLVPALIPLCIGDSAGARAITGPSPLLLALVAVGVHTAAMLAVTGAIAAGVCSGFLALSGAVTSASSPRPWRGRFRRRDCATRCTRSGRPG